MYIIIIIGMIFCHVDKTKQFNQFILFIILINQFWNGGYPNFIKIEKFTNKFIQLKLILILIIIDVVDKISIEDLIA